MYYVIGDEAMTFEEEKRRIESIQQKLIGFSFVTAVNGVMFIKSVPHPTLTVSFNAGDYSRELCCDMHSIASAIRHAYSEMCACCSKSEEMRRFERIISEIENSD